VSASDHVQPSLRGEEGSWCPITLDTDAPLLRAIGVPHSGEAVVAS